MAQTDWRDWANLSDGPAGLIAELVLAGDVVDYIRLRAVCRPWRRCSTDPRRHSGLDRRFHPRHWIMLREQVSPPHSRRFLNISTGECIKLDIPDVRDNTLLKPIPEGLLLVLHERTHIRLLNPFTRHFTELPPVSTLMPPANLSNDYFTGCGSGITSDSRSFVLCIPWLRVLGIAKPGDDRWTLVKYKCSDHAPALMFSGHFYHVNENNLMVLKMSADQPPRLKIVVELQGRVHMFCDSVHLVDNEGELMLVRRTDSLSPSRRYDVYRVDLDNKTLFAVNSFTGRAMFMGMGFSFFVSPRVFPSICGDTIYLSVELHERVVHEIEAYHLPDRSTTPANYILDDSVSWEKQLVPWPHTIVDCLSLCDTLGSRSGVLASVV